MADTPRTPPATVNGLPVVAFVALPDDPPTATGVHVVICRNDFRPLASAYVVWTVYRTRDGSPVMGDCRSDLPWDAALDVLISRVRHLG